jgi:hypothetical protein
LFRWTITSIANEGNRAKGDKDLTLLRIEGDNHANVVGATLQVIHESAKGDELKVSQHPSRTSQGEYPTAIMDFAIRLAGNQ